VNRDAIGLSCRDVELITLQAAGRWDHGGDGDALCACLDGAWGLANPGTPVMGAHFQMKRTYLEDGAEANSMFIKLSAVHVKIVLLAVWRYQSGG